MGEVHSARVAALRAVLRVTVGGIFPEPVAAGVAWTEQPREAPVAGVWTGERTTAAGSPGVPTQARRAAPRRRKPRARLLAWAGWPLLAVLAVQALLSLRLVRADTAFQDEATYLWAGHLQWAHWLHGTPVPPFPAYFSGAPVIYPPLAAVADNLGGLTGARVMSLVFMLGATVLLWSTTRRLFGRRAAFFAAALFAVLGPTLHLGAFATYDAMSVLLVALATWCVIRPGDRGEATGWMIVAGAALALANAAAYSSALFDVVVLALAVLAALPAGRRVAARRFAVLLITVGGLVTVGLLAGGGSYLTGLDQTTLTRVASSASSLSVLIRAWSWTGVVLVPAVGAIVISALGRGGRRQTWLLAVLAAAALLGPVEQARLHTLASLNKHVGLGALFAAIAAGYAVDRFISGAPAGRSQAVTCGALVAALIFPTALGASQSRAFATDWPNATSFLAIFGPLAGHSSGHLLVEDASIARYYLPSGSDWQRWSTTRNIVLPSGANTAGPSPSAGVTGTGNAGVYAAFITHGYFQYIALNFADTTALDHKLATQLHRDPRYRIIDVIPYSSPADSHGTYVIWRYEPHR